jgi:hypothetical protein
MGLEPTVSRGRQLDGPTATVLYSARCMSKPEPEVGMGSEQLYNKTGVGRSRLRFAGPRRRAQTGRVAPRPQQSAEPPFDGACDGGGAQARGEPLGPMDLQYSNTFPPRLSIHSIPLQVYVPVGARVEKAS